VVFKLIEKLRLFVIVSITVLIFCERGGEIKMILGIDYSKKQGLKKVKKQMDKTKKEIYIRSMSGMLKSYLQ
jgi:hypothetical protein